MFTLTNNKEIRTIVPQVLVTEVRGGNSSSKKQ